METSENDIRLFMSSLNICWKKCVADSETKISNVKNKLSYEQKECIRNCSVVKKDAVLFLNEYGIQRLFSRKE